MKGFAIHSCFLFWLWVTTDSIQGSLLTLCSGVIPGSTGGTRWDAGGWTWVGCMQGRHLSQCTIDLATHAFTFSSQPKVKWIKWNKVIWIKWKILWYSAHHKEIAAIPTLPRHAVRLGWFVLERKFVESSVLHRRIPYSPLWGGDCLYDWAFD